jgi:hypothetical protein
VISITLNPIRTDVPVTGAWDVATYMANPRTSVESNHNGAGTRA